MPGSLFGLPLSQRIDKNGKPLSGGKLYITESGSVPATVYKDYSLDSNNIHPYPITLDSIGQIPQFWLEDGAYNARLYDKAGVVQFNVSGVTTLGPSSGEGGGGGGVDAETIFQVGDVLWLDQSGTRSGWVRDNGRTIGSATSGASERANADCEDLFLFGYAEGWTVVGGTTGTAADDWAANKQITLPDKRGCGASGLDDMGNSAASRYTGVPVVSGSVTTAGSVIGESVHTLLTTEIPSHDHDATQESHSHVLPAWASITSDAQGVGGGLTILATTGSSNPATDSKQPAIDVSNTGGGGSHNNVQRSVLGTWYRKL